MGQPSGVAATPRVGVLFVHGIGEQKRGQTLTQFGEPLLEWLTEWIRFRKRAESVRVSDATIVEGDETEPAHVHVSVQLSDPKEELKLTFAEAWWASTFLPASFRQVWSWGLLFYWHVWRRIASRALHATRAALAPDTRALDSITPFKFAISFGVVPYLLLAAMAFQIAIMLLLAIGLVLGMVSIALIFPLGFFAPLKPFLSKTQLALANSAGDARALLKSPFAFHAMTTAVSARLAWLEDRCDKAIVIAHSQGSVIAYEMLVEEKRPKLAAFVTLGTALNLLQRESPRRVDPGVASTSTMASAEGRIDEFADHFSSIYPGVPWHNFWAPFDPVCNGPLSKSPATSKLEFQVSNRASILKDHSTYQMNTEEFVSPVADLIAAQAGIELGTNNGKDGALHESARIRRKTRVGVLLISKINVFVAAALCSIVFHQDLAPHASGVLSPIIGFFNKDAGEFLDRTAGNAIVARVIGFCAVALIVCIFLFLVGPSWRAWDNQSRWHLMKHEEPEEWPAVRLLFLIAGLVPVTVAAMLLIFEGKSDLQSLGSLWQVSGAVIFALTGTWFLLSPSGPAQLAAFVSRTTALFAKLRHELSRASRETTATRSAADADPSKP